MICTYPPPSTHTHSHVTAVFHVVSNGQGDVIVEEDGSAWFLEGTTYTYLGLYKDKVADAPGGTSTA